MRDFHSKGFRACNPTNNNFPYSWEGTYLRNDKGIFLCNFRSVGEENVYFENKTNSFQLKDKNSTNESKDLLAPVNSFNPPCLDLYNLNGNVAEFIAEGYANGGSWKSPGYDVRNESSIKTTDPSTGTGFRPVFSVRAK